MDLCTKRQHLRRKFPFLCIGCPRDPSMKRELTAKELAMVNDMLKNYTTWDKMAAKLWEMDGCSQ